MSLRAAGEAISLSLEEFADRNASGEAEDVEDALQLHNSLSN